MSTIKLQSSAIWQRWCVAQIFHPFPASAKSDGMKFSLLAQTIHPIPVSVKSDDMKFSLLAQAIHPIPVSVKSDCMKFSLLAQAIHPIPVSVKSDDMKFSLLAQAIQPLPVLAKSDGMTDMKCLNGLHLQKKKVVSDGDFWQKRPNGPNRRFPCSEGQRIITLEGQWPFTQGAAHVTQRRHYEILYGRDRWSGKGSGKREW